MSQALSIYQLREEANRLRQQVEDLQTRLERQTQAAAAYAAAEVESDVWNVPPYSWVVSAWTWSRDFCAHLVHSFHEYQLYARSLRRNRAARAALSPDAFSDAATLRLI